ncbi:MAG: PAS domain-containing sensor histidine kinase, partial [Ignavibacteriae bacterium]|nr:PAS domain-containing sensor histidine kinase [Ignavibacteriota bacterium]
INGTILETNNTACKKYGYTHSEYQNLNFFELIPNPFRNNIKKNLEQIIFKKNITIETPQIPKKGKEFSVELDLKAFNNEGKKTVLVTAKDVYSNKTYIEQLENERELFQALMDNIPDRIYFKDINSKFTMIDKAHAVGFNLKSPSEAIGKCDHDFFDKKHADQALKDERKIIKTKKGIISKFEREKIQLSGNQYEWVHSTKVPIINKSGEVTGIVGITRSASDLKNAENKILKYAKELQYLNATKDKFFSILAHDLKNPFFSLLGFAELLSNNFDELTDEEKKEYISYIIKISKNSYQLLESLLKWAATQTGRIEYCPQKLDLKILLDNSTEFFTPIAQKKKINIENNIKSAAMVYADPDMMRTIIRNLLTNAIKFTKNDGVIKLDAIEESRNYKIIVSDCGMGMDTQTIKNLFRIDTAHKSIGTSNEIGTGLGLIICKEFVEKNGGHINVTSKLGKGSKFSFTVPKFS